MGQLFPKREVKHSEVKLKLDRTGSSGNRFDAAQPSITVFWWQAVAAPA